jgi:hypothetical protein
MNHKLYNDVKEAVFDYVRGGGIVVCACSFAAFLFIKECGDPTIPFFAKVGLPWCAATCSYYRSTFHVNKNVVPEDAKSTLPRSYSQKALTLFQVPSEQCWYLPDMKTSWMESNSCYPRPNPQWTPVAFGKVELGFIGYIGDVNAEVETDDIVLTMCSLTVDIRDCFELNEGYEWSLPEMRNITMGWIPSNDEVDEHKDQIGTPTENTHAVDLEEPSGGQIWTGRLGLVEGYVEKLEVVADEEYDSDIEDFETTVDVEKYFTTPPARKTTSGLDEDDFWGLD